MTTTEQRPEIGATVDAGPQSTSRAGWHESINNASVLKLPCIFVVENNQFAYSTPLSLQSASKTFAVKATAYGIPEPRSTVPTSSPSWPLAPGSPMFRETIARLDDRGLEVADVEIIRLTPNTRPADAIPLLEIGAGLGARFLNVFGDDPRGGTSMYRPAVFGGLR